MCQSWRKCKYYGWNVLIVNLLKTIYLKHFITMYEILINNLCCIGDVHVISTTAQKGVDNKQVILLNKFWVLKK